MKPNEAPFYKHREKNTRVCIVPSGWRCKSCAYMGPHCPIRLCWHSPFYQLLDEVVKCEGEMDSDVGGASPFASQLVNSLDFMRLNKAHSDQLFCRYLAEAEGISLSLIWFTKPFLSRLRAVILTTILL